MTPASLYPLSFAVRALRSPTAHSAIKYVSLDESDLPFAGAVCACARRTRAGENLQALGGSDNFSKRAPLMGCREVGLDRSVV